MNESKGTGIGQLTSVSGPGGAVRVAKILPEPNSACEPQPSCSLIQEFRLRRWARENYVPPESRSETWHPVVLEEMGLKDAEIREQETPRAVAWSPDHATQRPAGLHDSTGDLRSQDVRGQETHAQRAALSAYVPLVPDGRHMVHGGHLPGPGKDWRRHRHVHRQPSEPPPLSWS